MIASLFCLEFIVESKGTKEILFYLYMPLEIIGWASRRCESLSFFEGSLTMYYFSRDINKTPLKVLTLSITVINSLRILMLPSLSSLSLAY